MRRTISRTTMIQFTNVEFTYPDQAFAMSIPELSIRNGEHVAVVGPSGSGKTTLLALVAGALTPQSGSVTCGERNLSQLDESARRRFRLEHVGMVFQEFALLEYLSVRDNVLLPYRLGALKVSEDSRDRAEELARSVGLDKHLDRYPQKLSFGERQRVAICRALVTSPSIVLADEPTGNLDDTTTDEVMTILINSVRQSSATLIMVTHNRRLLDRFDRTIDVTQFAVATHA
ncbi:MAG: ABC transporter ATP-binding protein [Phycisphaerae bacterium]|nr:MAG: ABC transporter ATP-binding protein [Phycisphaerae bacterium]